MFSDKVLQALHPLQLQQVVNRYESWTVVFAAVVAALVALVVDYAHMLYLRSKMVGAI